MDAIKLKGYQMMLLDFLADVGKGDLKAWPNERLSFVAHLMDTMNAAEMAQLFHFYVVNHLNAAYMAKRAIYCGLLHGQDGSKKQ